MDSNGQAPNYQTISSGNMGYESLVYTFAQILSSYNTAKVLPNFITIRPWVNITNNSTVFITMDQIRNAADTVQSHIETKHQLPDHVTISESEVTMPQFLKLEVIYLNNVNNNLYQSIVLQNYTTAPNPSESITGGNLNKTAYLTLADDLITFMDSNGRAPNFKPTIRGSIRYESLVYIYAEIVNSASRNLRLPNYIELTPWSVVSNSSTVFLTMDQINAAATTVKLYVETNHALPGSVTISGNTVTMPQLLKLEITSLKNINNGLYQSIVLENYSSASSPSETLTTGKINNDNYMTVADNIISYMDSNGKAPNYSWTSQGNMRFESLVYMYSQLLNYYNINTAFPDYITVNPWSLISNSNTVTFNTGQIISGAKIIQQYVETNHALPDSVTISGNILTMPQFLRLATTALHTTNKDYAGQLILQSYGLPTDTSETINGGILNKTQYMDLAREIEYFMYNNGRAPNFQNSTLGNISYQSLVYMYSQILSSYNSTNTLPEFITVDPWSVVSNSSTIFVTTDQIKNASESLKSYVETNHTLPSSVTISGRQITMPQFLKILTAAVTNINGKLNTTIVLRNYNSPSNPSETITDGIFNSSSYLNMASSIISSMNANGQAPNYQTTNLGNVRFESLVYIYSLILNYYNENGNLPENITVTRWSTISNTNTTFFNLNQLEGAAKTVQNYVENNHQLPNTVNISGTTVSMSQFLQMASTAILNIDGSLYTSILLKNCSTASNPSENLTKQGKINQSDYLNLSSSIISSMNANGQAPNYQTTNLGNVRFESLVYMYSQILSSYNSTNTLPEFITVDPWSVVSNSSTIFVTTDQIKNASESLKSYVETNHTLPSSVTISGRQITMPQFLKLSVNSVINIESYLNTSIILDNLGSPTNASAENITVGTLSNDEFLGIATEINKYIDSNQNAPNNVYNTSLGSSMGYESLVYMFANIMTSYNTTESTPDQVSIIPWLALSNPNGTFNFRTQKIFNNIQSALDDTDTLSGDTIWLQKLNYTENSVINKKITIRSVTGVTATVQALDPNLPVFTINTGGNGTTIQDIILNGSINNVAIFVNSSTGNQILGNNITGCVNGIYLYNSTETVISGNNILNNNLNGIIITGGSDNEVSSNKLISNGSTGINIQNSSNNKICSNKLYNNQDGICLNNSSAEIHFNSIVGNFRYGLYTLGNSTANVTNNWWGSNSPTTSLNNPTDIYTVGGTVTYNPWLILSISGSTDRSDRNGACYNYTATADLTHNNQGKDTSPDGNVPDDIPINFNSTIGTINNTGSTKKGKVELKLANTTVGTANISAILDNQTVSMNINMTTVDVSGVYNTRTNKSFETIQSAIDDVDTLDGDILTLNEGVYTENIVINKRVTITPVTGANVIIKAKSPDKSVILVVNAGSGSTIQGLTIVGGDISYGIALSHAYDCTINNNVISNSTKDVYVYCSGNNHLIGNTVEGSTNGIALYNSISNNISNNTIINCENGIFLVISDYNTISGNTISDNYYGGYIQHSNNINVTGNNVKGNWVGIYLYDNNNNYISRNNFTDNGAGITYYNSMSTTLSENSFNENWLTDTSVIDSGEVIMATTAYTCGPAALATILKKWGVYTTEAELAKIAKTDETGTSLLGLRDAALSKGINAFGYVLNIGQLKNNYIVVLKINGYNHFEVIQNITNDTVTLFDPNLGIVQMNVTTFNDLYTGYAFVLNETIPGVTQLSESQMSDIKGLWHTVRTIQWRWHPGSWRTYTKVINRSIPYPVITWSYHRGVNIWTPWGSREVGGFWYPSGYKIKYYHIHFTIRVRYYVPGYPEPYVTYKRVSDTSDINYVSFITACASGVGGASLLFKGLTVGAAAVLTAEEIPATSSTVVGIVGQLISPVINPDPNPSGKGEGVVNMIDPCWEPYLSK
jgi:parallel beta-helix repeat protein